MKAPPDVKEDLVTPPSVSATIANYIAQFKLSEAPATAIENARRAMIDSIGVMLAGSTEHAFRIVLEMVLQERASPQASIVGHTVRTTPQLAAFANGVALHAMDYDMTHFIGQPMSPMVAAILAVAEARGSTQSEILSAYIVGFEVCSRMVRSNLTQGSSGGWHSVSTLGPIATAAALCRLLESPRQASQNAIGMAASMASGVGANYGTMTKPLHCGHAARNGVVATMLALDGFTANPKAIEAKSGYFDVLARGLAWNLEPFEDLGRSHDLVDRGIWIKRYPCGALLHSGIDAALRLREELGSRLEDIAEIHVGVTKYTAKRAWLDYPNSIEAAKFNMNFLVSYALTHGAPGIAAFSESAIADERVRALAGRITVGVDAEFAELVEAWPARVTARLVDGSKREVVQQFSFESYKTPLPRAELEDKFFECAGLVVSRTNAQQLLALLSTLGEQPSFERFWPLLRNE